MIRVRIFVVFYNRLITIALPDDVLVVDQLIPALEKRLNLPWLDYVIKLEGKDEAISPKKTLRDLKVRNDDILVFDFLRPQENSEVILPPVEEVPAEIAYKSTSRGRRFPDWAIILLLIALVTLCFSLVIVFRSWDIYGFWLSGL